MNPDWERCNVTCLKSYSVEFDEYYNMKDKDIEFIELLKPLLPKNTINIYLDYTDIEIELENGDIINIFCDTKKSTNEYCRSILYDKVPYMNEDFNDYAAKFLSCDVDIVSALIDIKPSVNILIKLISYHTNKDLDKFIEKMPNNIKAIVFGYDSYKELNDEYVMFYNTKDIEGD